MDRVGRVYKAPRGSTTPSSPDPDVSAAQPTPQRPGQRQRQRPSSVRIRVSDRHVAGTATATKADQDPRKTPPQRGAGSVFGSNDLSAMPRLAHKMPDRAPPESAMRSAVPATRQAAGAPSAWSQPSNQPTSDHADGATLGRRDAKASQRPRRSVMRASPGQRQESGSGTASGIRSRGSCGFQRQRQVSAAGNSNQRPMRPPGPDVQGHLRVVQGGDV